MREFLLNLDGHRERVRAERIGSDIWLHCRGETWVVSQLPKAKENSNFANQDFSGAIVAPMPGKILKTNVKVGEAVRANQVLIVMEAMKMEYTLSTPSPGVVYELNCKEGEQVDLNTKLAFVKVGVAK